MHDSLNKILHEILCVKKIIIVKWGGGSVCVPNGNAAEIFIMIYKIKIVLIWPVAKYLSNKKSIPLWYKISHNLAT